MSHADAAARGARPAIGFFERYLTVWVALCIVAGIALGQLLPQVFQAVGRMELAHVNLPVGVLIWVMIVPMLVKIDFSAMAQVRNQWRGIGVTLFVNWFVKPFSMALLGWFFVRHVFAPWLPANQLDSYIAGLILLAAAPCTAMVFVWSKLCEGDPYFTLSQVALNDSIMVVAFAPLVALLLAALAVPHAASARDVRGALDAGIRAPGFDFTAYVLWHAMADHVSDVHLGDAHDGGRRCLRLHPYAARNHLGHDGLDGGLREQSALGLADVRV